MRSLGSLMFWAAGNDTREINRSDRDDDDLIVVGNVDFGGNLAFDSAYGTFVDLVAPGVNIYTTTSDNNSAYIVTGGTSIACPLAAGLAALIWSKYPSLTPDQVEAMIKIGCEDSGGAGRREGGSGSSSAETSQVTSDINFESGTWPSGSLSGGSAVGSRKAAGPRLLILISATDVGP